MNDDDSLRTDVLDDDGAPHGARRRAPQPTITNGKEHEPSAPVQAPTAGNRGRARTNILGAVAVLLLATAPALAQTTQIEPTATSNRPITLEAPSGSPAVAPGQPSTPSAFREMRTADLIGESVYNTGGESIGEIEDIVVNRNDNALAAVVGMGGFLGGGEKRVAVLLSDLEMQGNNIVVKTLTRTDFQRRPAYQSNAWVKHARDRLIGSAAR